MGFSRELFASSVHRSQTPCTERFRGADPGGRLCGARAMSRPGDGLPVAVFCLKGFFGCRMVVFCIGG